MRLGIFGGSFDPVHFGHLLLAEYCREHCGLDRVWLMPAAVPPHKRQQRLTLDRQRVEMLELAIAGHSALEVSTAEIDRGGVSYTVDTLQTIAEQRPDAELFLLMGGDSLEDLPGWRRADEVCRLATPVIVRRHGSPEPDVQVLAEVASAGRLADIARQVAPMPRIELSSSEIRRRVAAGQSIRYQTPRAVEEYIRASGLYR